MRRGERSAAGEVAGGRDEAGGGVARFGGEGEWWPGSGWGVEFGGGEVGRVRIGQVANGAGSRWATFVGVMGVQSNV
jgi:hypothetical protein